MKLKIPMWLGRLVVVEEDDTKKVYEVIRIKDSKGYAPAPQREGRITYYKP